MITNFQGYHTIKSFEEMLDLRDSRSMNFFDKTVLCKSNYKDQSVGIIKLNIRQITNFQGYYDKILQLDVSIKTSMKIDPKVALSLEIDSTLSLRHVFRCYNETKI